MEELFAMTALYWMINTADSKCNYEGTLPAEAYYSESYKKTAEFFIDYKGSPGNWSFIFDGVPCDISRTPFHPIVSTRFANLAKSLGADAEYYPVNIKIGDKSLIKEFFFAIPKNRVSAIDRNSPRVRVFDNDSRFPNWIESFSRQKSFIKYSEVGMNHWSLEKEALGLGWIISETFKDAIEKNELTGFNFFEAKPSPNT